MALYWIESSRKDVNESTCLACWASATPSDALWSANVAAWYRLCIWSVETGAFAIWVDKLWITDSGDIWAELVSETNVPMSAHSWLAFFSVQRATAKFSTDFVSWPHGWLRKSRSSWQFNYLLHCWLYTWYRLALHVEFKVCDARDLAIIKMCHLTWTDEFKIKVRDTHCDPCSSWVV